MAGDWIAIRCDLPDDPAVISLSLDLGVDIDAVVGKLLRLWAWFDSQTIAGRAACASRDFFDEKCRQKNFCAAVEKVGWLRIENGTASIPKFERWNGKSGKRRLLHARRARAKRAQDVSKTCASKAHKKRTTGQDRTGQSALETASAVSASKPPAKPVRVREPDPIWDTLCEVYGLKPVTKPEGSRVGRLVRDLKAKSATAADIRTRAGRWRIIHPGDGFNTPEALVKHWDELSKEPRNGSGIGKIQAPPGTNYNEIAKARAAKLAAGYDRDDVSGDAGQGSLLREDQSASAAHDPGVQGW